MDSNIDVFVEELQKIEFKDLQDSRLMLNFSGKTVSPELVNTIRRLCIDWVPSYAFNKYDITIENNTSIFNNDYMRLRLSQIIIPDINNDIYYLDTDYWYQVDYSNPNRDKHPDDKKVLELYIQATNTTLDVLNVTSKHSRLYENGDEIYRFDENYPHQILLLRPGEMFSCRMIASLGIGKNNDIWSPSHAYHDYDDSDDTNIKLTLESRGQMDEYEILYKACLIIKIKLNKIKDSIINTYEKSTYESNNRLKLVLENEDHTTANLLNTYLQLNNNIIFSGCAKPNLLVDTMVIKLETNGTNPIDEIVNTIEYINEIFDTIKMQILELGQKYINFNYNE